MFFTSKPLSPQGRHMLIAGASSGFGRETTLHLAGQGFQVVTGVCRQEDGERLTNAYPSGRVSTLLINVTDEESIGQAAAQMAEKADDTGFQDLVNNARIRISAPLECASNDLLRRQPEVNLVGQPAVTRAILPLSRRGDAARLVNAISSLGSVAIPYLDAYSAAQFAKEGVIDALRHELAPMGIQVSVVSPGAIWTLVWDKIAGEGERALIDAPDAIADLYRNTYLRFLQASKDGMRNSATKPTDVAAAVRAALTAAKPRTHYRVGADMRRDTLLTRLLPDSMIDEMFCPIVTAAPAAKEEQHA